MSTYNGEKFVRAQIDSILKQKDVEVYLVIRDDGSSDDTVNIINSYAASNPNIFSISSHNLGCKKSFFLCAEYVYKRFKDIQYFAFSDQDDVWLGDKLSAGINNLKNNLSTYEKIPLLYFCTPEIVDSHLNSLGIRWRAEHQLSFVEACLVFNREALRLVLMGQPERMSMHDSWMYKAVLACGGIVVEDKAPHILYRQHGNNVIGIPTFSSRWKKRYRNSN